MRRPPSRPRQPPTDGQVTRGAPLPPKKQPGRPIPRAGQASRKRGGQSVAGPTEFDDPSDRPDGHSKRSPRGPGASSGQARARPKRLLASAEGPRRRTGVRIPVRTPKRGERGTAAGVPSVVRPARYRFGCLGRAAGGTSNRKTWRGLEGCSAGKQAVALHGLRHPQEASARHAFDTSVGLWLEFSAVRLLAHHTEDSLQIAGMFPHEANVRPTCLGRVARLSRRNQRTAFVWSSTTAAFLT
ncbi:hypothetical protein ISCGN_016657 [Ixodes scapularis]